MNRDLVFGAVCLALAVGYYVMAAAIPESALSDTVGPQGLPKTYALVLAALSLVLIVRSVRVQATPQSPAADAIHWSSGLRIAGMLVIGILYLLLVPTLGYILSLAGLIAATTYYQGGGLNARVAFVALSGALFFWALFVAVLGIPHPPGIWPSLF